MRCPPAELPPAQSFPEAVGCLYVLEGSTLGTQIITQHILKTVFPGQSTDVGGLSFYRGYGSATRQMWREFCDFLGAYSGQMTNETERHEAARAARQTFERFGRWVCGPSPELRRPVD